MYHDKSRQIIHIFTSGIINDDKILLCNVQGMRYPYKLEALIRGEVVKSYNVKPNRGSVDSEDMTSSEEEVEQDSLAGSDGTSLSSSRNIMMGTYSSHVLGTTSAMTDFDDDLEDGGKHGMMGVVRTNSILTEAATKNMLINKQNSQNTIPMPSGLATVLKKRLSPSNLNLGKAIRNGCIYNHYKKLANRNIVLQRHSIFSCVLR